MGMGGRRLRTGESTRENLRSSHGRITYADGTKTCRASAAPGRLHQSVSEHAHGTKLMADNRRRTLLRAGRKRQGSLAIQGPTAPTRIRSSMDDLASAIRGNKEYNEGERGAQQHIHFRSSAAMATYSGQPHQVAMAINAQVTCIPTSMHGMLFRRAFPDRRPVLIANAGQSGERSMCARVNKEIIGWTQEALDPPI